MEDQCILRELTNTPQELAARKQKSVETEFVRPPIRECIEVNRN